MFKPIRTNMLNEGTMRATQFINLAFTLFISLQKNKIIAHDV